MTAINLGLGSLTEIANGYGTDKGTVGPSSAWGAHNYTDIYEAYLSSLRDRPINLLEIGLGVRGANWRSDIVHGRNSGGASIKMWSKYFPKARIFGIDVNACSYLDTDRISTYVVDQGDAKQLAALLEKLDVMFDVIIDDGSHRPDHQQTSLSYLFPALRSGGIYFIEDLLWNGFADGEQGRFSSDSALNTRALLKNYKNKREFATPNAIQNATYLKEHIREINFHSPTVRHSITFRRRFPRPFSSVSAYTPDSERLCAIKKV